VWLVFTQLGLMYRAGSLTRRAALALVVGGGSAMLLCVYVLGYPVSMVGTASGPSNTVPPTVALMFQGILLIGLAVLAHDLVERWLHGARVWAVTCAASACAMTVYLWHLPALILTLAIVHYAGWFPAAVAQAPSGIPVPGPQYAEYMLVTVPLFLLLTLACVAAFWRIEHAHLPLWDSTVRHPWRMRPAAQGWSSALGVVAVTFGVLVIGVTGFAGFPARVSYWSVIPLSPPAALVCMLAGLLVLRALSLGPRTDRVDRSARDHLAPAQPLSVARDRGRSGAAGTRSTAAHRGCLRARERRAAQRADQADPERGVGPGSHLEQAVRVGHPHHGVEVLVCCLLEAVGQSVERSGDGDLVTDLRDVGVRLRAVSARACLQRRLGLPVQHGVRVRVGAFFVDVDGHGPGLHVAGFG
jgi:hypothetical protein